MDRIVIKDVRPVRYQLMLDESVYADLLEQLQAAEMRARKIHTAEARELANDISKAIGLVCCTEFRKNCTGITLPIPTDQPAPYIRGRIKGNTLAIELAGIPGGAA